MTKFLINSSKTNNSKAGNSKADNLKASNTSVLLITPGEPAGIGPDLVILYASQKGWPANWVLVASPELLRQRAQLLGVDIEIEAIDVQTLDVETLEIEATENANSQNLSSPASGFSKSDSSKQPAKSLLKNTACLRVLPVQLKAPVEAGVLNPANATYVLETLQLATDLCLAGKAQALVTGPVHKGVINQAGINFTGHTEFLQAACQVEKVVMLLATPEMRVGLATTHLALKDVPAAITQHSLRQVIQIFYAGLQQNFGLPQPRLLVCGLNPHAGEDGHLGREELEVIIPVVEELRQEGLQLIGPLPADTLFTEYNLAQGDAVLAMYHDQGLPVLKYHGFGRAANITLGLPLVRTSVDHGTALSLAGTGQVDLGSLETALTYAAQFAANQANH